jgi:RNA polymerase sigma-70 factor (sigma-E family)
LSADADDAFEEFVRGRSARLFRLALLLTGQDQAEAAELLHVALERAYRRRATLSRTRSPEPYVRQILVCASIDRRRSMRIRAQQRHGLRHPLAGLPEPQAVSDQEPTTQDAAGELAYRRRLLRSLALLPPRQRAVLVLSYWEDLSDGEIARMLGCGVGAVRSQLSRGLARLRGTAGELVADQIAPAGAPADCGEVREIGD